MKEIDLFTPLQADFYPFDEEAYGDTYNNDDGIPLDGSELVDYRECIQAAVGEYSQRRGGDLMPHFTGSQEICEKVFSAAPDVAVRHGSLWGVTHLTLKEDLTESEFSELADYLTGQYADGWGEGFEQQKILLADGDLYVHFWRSFGYQFQTAQGWYGVIGKLEAEPGAQEPPAAPKRPKLKLQGQDGNSFARKYEITEMAHPLYPQLHRIRALIPVTEDVHPGDLGGYVESEGNLSQEHDGAWIYGEAICCEEACVKDQAYLTDTAVAKGCALVSGASAIREQATAKDDAIFVGGILKGSALLAGNGVLRANAVTGETPVADGKAVILGTVAGAVYLSRTAFVLPGQTIDNPISEVIVMDGRYISLQNQEHSRKPRGGYDR